MRPVVAFLILLFATDDRAVRQKLIADLLQVVDTRELTRQAIRAQFPPDDSSKEVVERICARIDYERIERDVFAARFDETFTTAELEQLVAFYKTAAGQKSFKLIGDLAAENKDIAMLLFYEIAQAVEEEIQREDLKKNPWKRTMNDLRSVATAVEAYATDTNSYPDVASYDQLKRILVPTYILELPERDVWGTAYAYTSNGESYRLASAGADRMFDWSSRNIEPLAEDFVARATQSLDADIIFQDGQFVQFPAQAEKALP